MGPGREEERKLDKGRDEVLKAIQVTRRGRRPPQ